MTVGNQLAGIQRPSNAEMFFANDLRDVIVGHANCAGLALLNMHRNKAKNVSESMRVAPVSRTCGRVVSMRRGGDTTHVDSETSVGSSDVGLYARDGESSQTERNDGS